MRKKGKDGSCNQALMKLQGDAVAKCGVKLHLETHTVKCEQWQCQVDAERLYSSLEL